MTDVSAETAPKMNVAKPAWKDDPEQYRMTLGEHLEELRWRIILALIGFVVVFAGCLFYGGKVTSIFCGPMVKALQERDINPQLFYTEIGEPFMVYIKISLISAASVAAPWIVYQLWLFVAAGLYPSERKWITRYIPLSIALLISGMLFVYFIVLPWSIEFLIDWGNSIPIPELRQAKIPLQPGQALPVIPHFAGDPDPAAPFTMWVNTLEGKVKIALENGHIRAFPFTPSSLLAPHITLATYIDLVVMMLLLFGLAFQLPLAVMAIARIGIVDVAQLRKARRVVYFVLLVLASIITPGDVITATIALLGPLILLYEFGIVLAARGAKRAEEDDGDDSDGGSDADKPKPEEPVAPA